jgi:hypothetical protein
MLHSRSLTEERRAAIIIIDGTPKRRLQHPINTGDSNSKLRLYSLGGKPCLQARHDGGSGGNGGNGGFSIIIIFRYGLYFMELPPLPPFLGLLDF